MHHNNVDAIQLRHLITFINGPQDPWYHAKPPSPRNVARRFVFPSPSHENCSGVVLVLGSCESNQARNFQSGPFLATSQYP